MHRVLLAPLAKLFKFYFALNLALVLAAPIINAFAIFAL
jgi:hypothetical protein